MDLATFCARIASLNLRNTDKAIALLWYAATHSETHELDVNVLREQLRSNGLGSPSASYLRTGLARSRSTMKGAKGYKLNQSGIHAAHELIKDVLQEPVSLSGNGQFLHESVWRPTRGYIERICVQLNGCVHYHFYDAAAVMIRRVTETLVIEAYEKLQRQSEIKGADDNYFMLGELITRATAPSGLSLGREAKTALSEIKSLGDRAAHNRRFIARKVDVEGLRSGFRVVFDELVAIARLR